MENDFWSCTKEEPGIGAPVACNIPHLTPRSPQGTGAPAARNIPDLALRSQAYHAVNATESSLSKGDGKQMYFIEFRSGEFVFTLAANRPVVQQTQTKAVSEWCVLEW
eukprot:1145263-Pelagomonas_calceolata.AAC.1